MKAVVLSDIHSNYHALKAVIKEINAITFDRLFVLGDIFGYYPWALETFSLLEPLLKNAIVIKGNHDHLILDEESPALVSSFRLAIRQNKTTLSERAPQAIAWLNKLNFAESLTADNVKLKLVHGTPANPCSGRYYPDDMIIHNWMPQNNVIILMGHTHYPLIKHWRNGLIINPGSVGQPRDRNPMPSWGILDTTDFTFSIQRTHYDNIKVMEILREMNWDPHSIQALNKK